MPENVLKPELPKGLFFTPRSQFIYFKIKKWDAVNGKWVWGSPISSKTTDPLQAMKTKEEAQRLADSLVETPDSAMTREYAFKMVNAILKWHGVPERIEDNTVPKVVTWEQFSTDWISDKAATGSAESTVRHYKSHLGQFTEFLSEGAPLTTIDRRKCQDFYNSLLAKRQVKTCNNIIKSVGMVLRTAVKDSLITHNPAEDVTLDSADTRRNEPFTVEDVANIRGHLPTLDHGNEWVTAFLFGICLGARLGDCTQRKFSEIILDGDTPHLIYIPEKTKRKKKVVKVPLVDPLLSHLRTLGPSDTDLITPNLAKLRTGGRNQLSDRFMNAIIAAGVPMETQPAKAKGGASWNSKGFHSTRHTLPSLMAAQGVPAEIRMAITGHSSEAVHHGYTHHDDQAMRQALESGLSVLQAS